jgi:hypothetical protein
MIKFQNILSRVLSQDDLEWAGVKQCFQDFYEKIKAKIQEDEILKRDIEEHMQEISDFIMLRLYKYVYASKTPSPKELEFFTKIQNLQWVQPEAFSISNDQITKPMWDIAVKELQAIDRAITPKSK